MNIGMSIRLLREKRGMSQAELSKKINISQSMLCQIERGTKTPSLPLGAEIASALGCTINDIISEKE